MSRKCECQKPVAAPRCAVCPSPPYVGERERVIRAIDNANQLQAAIRVTGVSGNPLEWSAEDGQRVEAFMRGELLV